MPIKFRCQHCQQLLGISRSRASAVVDCPQCGRSLRVPDLDGRTRKMPDPRSSATGDAALMSALTELSELGDPNIPDKASTDVPHEPDRRIVTVDVDAAAYFEPIETVPAAQSYVSEVEELGDDPVAIEESLEELAALGDEETGSRVSPELLQEMRQARNGGGSSATAFLLACVALAAGAAGGWFAKDAIDKSSSTTNQSQPGLAGDNGGLAQLNGREGVAQSDTLAVLRGTITWAESVSSTESGDSDQSQDASMPDGGATVFMLPSERTGSLKLSARSLLLEPDHPDRRATLAALQAIGGSITEADADGRFRASVVKARPVTVIAISKHVERPADVSPPAETVQLLDSYFDSTSHVVGRRNLKSLTIPAPSASTQPVDFHFTGAP
ncbi:hypothetical protein Fuma_05197 [Fuerstiella marisgermanici]|uniref:Uncharacterized protein n=2 Tax=Fuerstiella marisgermanici TaxID=1891926 RepID=A0A1P8WNB5_9PLAN|nr:hypothetical protein Fuma_05197 [Fuerstiella marisgermanici]